MLGSNVVRCHSPIEFRKFSLVKKKKLPTSKGNIVTVALHDPFSEKCVLGSNIKR